MAQRPAALQSLRIPLDDIEDIAFWRQLNERGLNGTPLYFRPFIDAKPRRIAAVLSTMARCRPGGIIFHCSAGRDRAGLVALLMLALADVTVDAIVEDYELSLSQTRPLYDAFGVEQDEPSMRAGFQQRGTTIRAAITGLLDGLDAVRLLHNASVAETDIGTLQNRLRG